MPTNEERDDLKPTLKQVLDLKKNPDQLTMTLSTKIQAVANEVNKTLKPLGIELKNDPNNQQNQQGKTAALYSATLTNEAAVEAMNQLNKNPILQSMGQSLAQKMGQTPSATLPNPFNTGIPKNVRK